MVISKIINSNLMRKGGVYLGVSQNGNCEVYYGQREYYILENQFQTNLVLSHHIIAWNRHC